MVNVTVAARATVAGFAAAFSLGGNSSVPITKAASTIAPFFLPNYTSFTLGNVTVAPNETFTAEGVVKKLARFEELGLGTDIRVVDSKIEVVSPESALCWLTIEIFPDTACVEGWNWTNVYGFRMVEGRKNGLTGGWEFVNSDWEEEQLLSRFPDF